MPKKRIIGKKPKKKIKSLQERRRDMRKVKRTRIAKTRKTKI